MADSRVYHLVCEVCEEEFQHPTIRKTCSDDCRTRSFQEQHAALVSYRQSLIKTCKECGRVFTWEDLNALTEGNFVRRTCCSAECHRLYQKKETIERNSVLYYGVKLPIEDVCTLEQKSLHAIRALLNKKSLPNAKWADPKRRDDVAKRRSTRRRRDHLVTVRLTKEHVEELQRAAERAGLGLSDWAASHLLQCARQNIEKEGPES